ncbi:MAG TPA: hypothetical protein VEI52_12800, partial [Terriglobales bacterium]|nr:hypothetical protein [Terriglobales bacterium]
HCSTGKRGYLGNLASLAERWHRKKVDPRSDSIRRMKWQSAHRPMRAFGDSFALIVVSNRIGQYAVARDQGRRPLPANRPSVPGRFEEAETITP